MSGDGFDLDALVRDAFETTADHHDAWEKVEANLDSETVWLAVRKMGPDYARKIAGVERNRLMVGADPLKVGTPRKKAAALLRHEQAMRKSLPLSLDGKAKKFLGDCTRDDLLAAAEIRERTAAATVAAANKLRALAEKLRVYRADTVRELDADLYWEAMR